MIDALFKIEKRLKNKINFEKELNDTKNNLSLKVKLNKRKYKCIHQ